MAENTRNWVPVVRWVARIWSLGPILFALAQIVFPHPGWVDIASGTSSIFGSVFDHC
jgi:hypothetical protein